MIHPVFVILDVAVEHGRAPLQSDLVRKACSIKPVAAINLVIANDVANAIGKISAPLLGSLSTPEALSCSRVAHLEFGALRQVRYLDHGKGLQVYLGKTLLQAGTKV